MLQHFTTGRPMACFLGVFVFLVGTKLLVLEPSRLWADSNYLTPNDSNSSYTNRGVGKPNLPVDDSWRRTSVGWERKEDWRHLTVSPVRRTLSFQTLIQRTWPATLAATELTLVLAILFLQPTRNQ